MSQTPSYRQQLLSRHADTIRRMVFIVIERDQAGLVNLLEPIANEGWTSLVPALVQVFEGERHLDAFEGLDKEDQIILRAVFDGLQDQSLLPERDHGIESLTAVPFLAAAIFDASQGQEVSLQTVSDFCQNLEGQDGTKPKLAKNIRRILDGARDLDILSERLDPADKSLIREILIILERLEA